MKSDVINKVAEIAALVLAFALLAGMAFPGFAYAAVDKSGPQGPDDTGSSLNEDEHIPESWASLGDAMVTARLVLGDSGAAQAEVDEVYNLHQAAMHNLVRKSSDSGGSDPEGPNPVDPIAGVPDPEDPDPTDPNPKDPDPKDPIEPAVPQVPGTDLGIPQISDETIEQTASVPGAARDMQETPTKQEEEVMALTARALVENEATIAANEAQAVLQETMIPDAPVPFAGGDLSAKGWSMLNLTLVVLTAVFGAVSLLVCHRTGEDEAKRRLFSSLAALGGAFAVIAAIALLVTQSFAGPMVWMDTWTIFYIVLAFVGLAIAGVQLLGLARARHK